jgi:putative transposase
VPAAFGVKSDRHSAGYWLRDDETALTRAILELATEYVRYGYRRLTALLRELDWHVNHKRVERTWRREGLKVPAKQPKRARLWLKDGSCARLRPERPSHVWSYHFVMGRTEDCRPFRMLTVSDEFTRLALAIRAERRLDHEAALETLSDLFLKHGTPVHIRSVNGPEFPPQAVRAWLAVLGVKTLFIETGSPWENGYNESFNDKLRDELLNGEIFCTLREPQGSISSRELGAPGPTHISKKCLDSASRQLYGRGA